jgi:hypothetical protein
LTQPTHRIEISLSQFLDFTLKQGIARIKQVRQIKEQGAYHPAKDFWKPLRDGIRAVHAQGLLLTHLDGIVDQVDQRKHKHYIEAIRQYKKFCKNKSIEWFDPGKAHWTSGDLLVKSTPELGLVINGVPHVVKLYFKEQTSALDKRGRATLLTLLNESQQERSFDEAVVRSVLNVKKSRLFGGDSDVNDDWRTSLELDADNFVRLWNRG